MMGSWYCPECGKSEYDQHRKDCYRGRLEALQEEVKGVIGSALCKKLIQDDWSQVMGRGSGKTYFSQRLVDLANALAESKGD